MTVEVLREPPPRQQHCGACGIRLTMPRENACSQVCADSMNAEVKRSMKRVGF